MNDSRSPPDVRLVVVRQFLDVPSALLAKSMLDSAEIDCFLADANIVRMDWFYSNAIGGVKLLVREDDAESATQLLDQAPVDEFDVPDVGHFEQPRCPKCSSAEVSYQGLQRNYAYGTVAIGLPFPVSHLAWHCAACNHAWED
jgi:Putative prokaryotic signal transducing protein